MVNSSKKNMIFLSNLRIVLLLKLKTLRNLTPSETKINLVKLPKAILTLVPLNTTLNILQVTKNEDFIRFFNLITSLSLWKSRPMKLNRPKKKIKKATKIKRFKKKRFFKFKYNLRRLMFRFRKSFLWKKLRKSRKGLRKKLMPILPLKFNKQKVLSRKAKKRRKNKQRMRLSIKKWRHKKIYKKPKRRFKLFSKQRVYMTKNSLKLHYPRFFVKKKIIRKLSTLNTKKTERFRKNLIKKVVKNKQVASTRFFLKKHSKRRTSFFINNKSLFNTNSVKIGPVERRLIISDLNTLDLKGYFSKVNLIPTYHFTKHPYMSKKKNFKRSIFMLRFFKGVDYDIIRSNIEVSKFLALKKSKKLWDRAGPSLIFNRVVLRQLRCRFRRLINKNYTNYQALKPLKFKLELKKFKRHTMGFSKYKLIKNHLRIRRELFISKFSNDYNILLDKSPVDLSSSLSFLSGVSAIGAVNKLSNFNVLKDNLNLVDYSKTLINLAKPIDTVDVLNITTPTDTSIDTVDVLNITTPTDTSIDTVDVLNIDTLGVKSSIILKNFFNRSLFTKINELLEQSSQLKKVTYPLDNYTKITRVIKTEEGGTNNGALTYLPYESAKYSDLLNKVDNTNILKINRNPLVESSNTYDKEHNDLSIALKELLNCYDTNKVKLPNMATTAHPYYKNNTNLIENNSYKINFKKEAIYKTITKSKLYGINAQKDLSFLKIKNLNNLKVKLLKLKKLANTNSSSEVRSRNLLLKKNKLKHILFKLNLNWRLPLRKNVKMRLSRKLDKKRLKSLAGILSSVNLRVVWSKILKLYKNKNSKVGFQGYRAVRRPAVSFEKSYSEIKINRYKNIKPLNELTRLDDIVDLNFLESKKTLRRPKLKVTRNPKRKKKSIFFNKKRIRYAAKLMKTFTKKFKSKYSPRNKPVSKKNSSTLRLKSLSNIRVLYNLIPKNWLKRAKFDIRSKTSSTKTLYFKSRSKWVNFRSKIRYFKPYYASIKYKFKKKVFINRDIYKKIKLNPKYLRTNKVMTNLLIKPRVKFLFNTSLNEKLTKSKIKNNDFFRIRNRFKSRSLNKLVKPLGTYSHLSRISKKKINKLKLVKPLNLEKLSNNTILFNNVIESIKPKLELMTYSKLNGPDRRARIKNKLRFITRVKPYKFLRRLMSFTTDTYSPFVKYRRYLNKQIARSNLETFKKNLFIDTICMPWSDREPYYEALALLNSRHKPVYNTTFIFKKFFFNQKSLSVLKDPSFKRVQSHLMGLFKVNKKKKNSLKKRLKKKLKKSLYAYSTFNNLTVNSKKINFILGKKKKLKKAKIPKILAQKDTRVSPSINNNLFSNKTLKVKSVNIPTLKPNSFSKSSFHNKPKLGPSFNKKQKNLITKGKVRKSKLLFTLKKKTREKKNLMLTSLLKAKFIKVFKAKTSAPSLFKYRYEKLKSISYLITKPANKINYLGFKKLKKSLKPSHNKLALKRTAAFLSERRPKAIKKIKKVTPASDRRIYMLYKSDSKNNWYKRRLYKPIDFYKKRLALSNAILKSYLTNSKSKRKNSSFRKNIWYFNNNKPDLSLLKNTKTTRTKKGLKESRKRIPILSKLYKITEKIKKARMGVNYKFNPKINLYRGKAYEFRAKLAKMSNLLSTKLDKNLNTFIKMYKRPKSRFQRLVAQRLKRKIFFGLKHNPETRYSLPLNKRYIKKKKELIDSYNKSRKVLKNALIRNPNHLPINIGRTMRLKKFKKAWKAAIRRNKDDISFSFKRKLRIFRRVMKSRNKSILSSSNLKKKTLNFNIRLLNANNTYKFSNWRLTLANSLEKQLIHLSTNNLSLFRYKDFALKLFKLYTLNTHFLNVSVSADNTSILNNKESYYLFNLNFLNNDLYKKYDDILPFLKKKIILANNCNAYYFKAKSVRIYLNLSKNILKKKKNTYGNGRTNFKIKKNKALIESIGIRNIYSKGYKIFFLNKFKLQLRPKQETISANRCTLAPFKLNLSTLGSCVLYSNYFFKLEPTRLSLNQSTSSKAKTHNFNTYSNKLSYLLLNNLMSPSKPRSTIFNKIYFNLKKLTIRQPMPINPKVRDLAFTNKNKSTKFIDLILKSKKARTKINLNNSLNTSIFFMWDLIATSITQCKLVIVNLDLIKFICKSENIIRIIAKKIVRLLFFEFRNLTPTFFIREVIYLIIISIRYKDATLFMNWLVMYMNKVKIKKHKKVIAFLRKLIRLLRKKNYFYRLGCLGFFFDIRGKVGVTGNKKKRNYVVRYGTSSSSNKNIRWSLEKGIVRTTTGVLGTTLIITY